MKRVAVFACLLLVVACTSLAQVLTHRIHLDQFGYLPTGKKVAVISDPQVGFNSSESYQPGNTLSLINVGTGQSVFSGTPVRWNGGATHGQSGDKGWWFDFSSVQVPGTYYLSDPSNNTRSHEFEIREDIYYDILKAAGRMFYYNRCGMAKAAPFAETKWTDVMNFAQDTRTRFINDPTNAALEKDLSGGWFDAGDYNKYVTFTSSTLHDLLNAYSVNPAAFQDDWNLPETGNGIPDLLDEVKWELDWLKKMQNPDGSVIIKMGSRNYVENTASPPSANTDTRYYGPTCTSAAITLAGVFAHAAKVFKGVPGLGAEADTLEKRAIRSWNYVLPSLNSGTLDETCDNGSIVAGDADRTAAEQKEEALFAAIYLFAGTGSTSYGTYITNHINDAVAVSGAWWGIANNSLNEALLYYTTLAGADAATVSTILNSLLPHAIGDWNGFFGFNGDDLYRAYMPDWSYHWGSSSSTARYSTLSQLLVAYGINSPDSASYAQKAEEQVHFFHGVNPLGMVMLSNMYGLGGDSCVNQLYHTWFNDGTIYDHAKDSPNGPAPGFVTGGPNKNYSYTALTPPYGQPHQKSYLDFNTGFPASSWEISEPAIYYQAAYIRMLAQFVSPPSSPLPVVLSDFDAQVVGMDVQLDWITQSENGTDKFEVERSADANNWMVIHTQPATGSTTTPTLYDYLDPNPWSADPVLYYRLKIVDRDGSIMFSNVQSVARPISSSLDTSEIRALQVFPNPVSDLLQVEVEALPGVELVIYAMDGQMLVRKMYDGSPVEIAHIPEGLYILVAQRNGRMAFKRFLKVGK